MDLWVPELQGPGGIQHYSRMFLRGLQEILPDGRVRVFSRNESYPASIPRPLTAIGFSSNLMAQTLVRRPHLTILTHLNFAPLAHLLNKFARLRYWVAAHGLESWGYLTPPRELALLCAEKILPVSHHTEQRLMGAHQLEASRSSILPNCIDGEIFFPGPKPNHLLRRYGLRPEQKVLFTLARMEPNDRYKGYDLVLDAMAEVRSTIPGVHYILAGRGSDNERLRGRIRALGLKQQVTLTGFLPARDLRDHYNLCDLFVMPSTGEGFGIVYLEALACGRPVVAGNEDGAREPLLHGELGRLVDPRNASQLAGAMVDYLLAVETDASREERRRRVLEHFGFSTFKERLRELLNDHVRNCRNSAD